MKQTFSKPIYMDNHATTPVDQRVLEAMLPFFTNDFGNASSIDHKHGLVASRAVEAAREEVAGFLNARPEEIIFTSGATESDNIVIFGVAEKYVDKGNHIITCVTEHKAILESCRLLEKKGFEITYLPVDKFGVVDVEKLKGAITPKTILISIMFGNNEIGTLAPIKEIGKIAKEHNIIFHTDAAQAFGHLPIDVKDLNINLLSFSAHKMYGPKGVGGLYFSKSNPRANISPVLYGGGQERGLRSGTLNVPGIVGIGKAVELAKKEMKAENKRLGALTQKMLFALSKEVKAELNGHPTERLAHNLNLYIPGIENKALINLLRDDLSISAGSACTTSSVKPSYVISALGYGDERSYSSVRFGLGRFNTEEEVDYAISKVIECTKKLKLLG